MQRILFAIIFEGRSGSSELCARLNAHPEIQAYPEILAPICFGYPDDDDKWRQVDKTFGDLSRGSPIESFQESYSKVTRDDDKLPIRGLKTRLNTTEDAWWYHSVGRTENFYAVEPRPFLSIAARYECRLIRLHRRDLLRQAVSWLRGVELAARHRIWNITGEDTPVEPIAIDPARVEQTIRWLDSVRATHAAAFDGYDGCKLEVSYEDLFGAGRSRAFHQVLDFLDASPFEALPHYRKATPGSLAQAIPNIDAILRHLRHVGLDHGSSVDLESTTSPTG